MLRFTELDWGIEPAKYTNCCNNTEVILRIHNYSNELGRFDVNGEIIETAGNSTSELAVAAIDNGGEYSAIPIMKLDQGNVRMRLWLKFEFK